MTIYLVRHGSAGRRDNGDPDDDLRPLDETGRLQADLLADHLGHLGIERVLSSPILRCQQTVAGVAAAAGIDVEVAAELAEGVDPLRAMDLCCRLAEIDAVLCSHGDVIPEVLQLLANRGVTFGSRRGFSKGGVWTLDTVDGEIVSANYGPTEPASA